MNLSYHFGPLPTCAYCAGAENALGANSAVCSPGDTVCCHGGVTAAAVSGGAGPRWLDRGVDR